VLNSNLSPTKYKNPDSTLIHDLVVERLRVIPDERGRLMEIMRRDDRFFSGFGQVYLSTIYPGVVKAWHYHRVQEDRFTCIKGLVKAAFYDDRENSPSRGVLNVSSGRSVHVHKRTGKSGLLR
jgi:dTDP-4-dehydrorhamnose 3,5-epimerase